MSGCQHWVPFAQVFIETLELTLRHLAPIDIWGADLKNDWWKPVEQYPIASPHRGVGSEVCVILDPKSPAGLSLSCS